MNKALIGIGIAIAVLVVIYGVLEITGFGKEYRPDLSQEVQEEIIIDKNEKAYKNEPIQIEEQSQEPVTLVTETPEPTQTPAPTQTPTPTPKEIITPVVLTYEQHVTDRLSREDVERLDDSSKYDWKTIIDYIDDKFNCGNIIQIGKMYLTYTDDVDPETGNHMLLVYVRRNDKGTDIRYIVKNSAWFEPELTDKETRIRVLQVLKIMVTDAGSIDLGI